MVSGRIVAGVLLCMSQLHAIVYSCSPPAGTPLCQFPEKVDITFIGTPIDSNYDPNPPGGSDVAFLGMWYRFSVKESFTGLRPQEREVVVWLSVGGGKPEIGRTFFVHAVREGRQIRLAACGNTRPVEEATTDIQYLRERLRGQFRSYISGSVLRHYKGSQYFVETGLDGAPRGLPGAIVVLRNGNTTFDLKTDERGQFRADDTVPGKYSMSLESAGYRTIKSYTIEVPSNGCGIGHAGMFTNAGIGGVVRRADGTPAGGVELDLIDAEPGYRSFTGKLDMIETGKDGKFSVAGLPSGRFLLGVNIKESSRYPDQTPPTYYPGAVDRSKAQVIELTPNESKAGLILTLPPPRAFRTVRVHLRWPDGRIPARGAIDAWANEGIYVSKYELKNGTFDLQLLQGVDYWLTAAALDETRQPTPYARGTWVYADNYRLSAGDDPVEVTVTAHFAEPQWANAVYSRMDTKK